MAQAKLTVSKEQAVKLTCLVHKKKPVYPILYEPKSGVNLHETKGTEKIEVPDGADLYNLKRFYEAGYFTVVEGKIADVTRFMSITVGAEGLTTLYFDQPVYTAGLLATDLEIKSDGVVVPDVTIGAVLKAAATKSLVIDIGSTPTAGKVVSVEIKASGAAKILDAGDVAIVAAIKSYTV